MATGNCAKGCGCGPSHPRAQNPRPTCKPEDGDPGRGIVNIVSTSPTLWTITYTDGTTSEVTIPAPTDGTDGRGIQSVTIAGPLTPYTLLFTFTDGTTTTATIPTPTPASGEDGDDGRGLTSMVLNAGQTAWTLTFTDATTVDVPFTMPVPVSVSTVTQPEGRQVWRVTLTDGTVQDIPLLPPPTPAKIQGINVNASELDDQILALAIRATQNPSLQASAVLNVQRDWDPVTVVVNKDAEDLGASTWPSPARNSLIFTDYTNVQGAATLYDAGAGTYTARATQFDTGEGGPLAYTVQVMGVARATVMYSSFPDAVPSFPVEITTLVTQTFSVNESGGGRQSVALSNTEQMAALEVNPSESKRLEPVELQTLTTSQFKNTLHNMLPSAFATGYSHRIWSVGTVDWESTLDPVITAPDLGASTWTEETRRSVLYTESNRVDGAVTLVDQGNIDAKIFFMPYSGTDASHPPPRYPISPSGTFIVVGTVQAKTMHTGNVLTPAFPLSFTATYGSDGDIQTFQSLVVSSRPEVRALDPAASLTYTPALPGSEPGVFGSLSVDPVHPRDPLAWNDVTIRTTVQ